MSPSRKESATARLPAPERATAEELRDAATVVLLRDAANGLEVLLLERPSDRGSFAGAWVFPGGAVDPEDRLEAATATGELRAKDDELAARIAAAREVEEECGLSVSSHDLVVYSRWTPPLGIPKRMHTWFFIGEAPAGSIRLAPSEVVRHRWIRPSDALAEHSAGGIILFPPTWVTLHTLAGHATVAAALDDTAAAARRRGTKEYVTRIATSTQGKVMVWRGDVAHEDAALIDTALIDAAGPHNRLEIGVLPWVYRNESDRD